VIFVPNAAQGWDDVNPMDQVWIDSEDDGVYPSRTERTEERVLAIAAQARRVIDSIEGDKPAGGVALWIALWDLRSLLLDVDADWFALPRPGGVA
jgi:hypothetical protein